MQKDAQKGFATGYQMFKHLRWLSSGKLICALRFSSLSD